ncbi:hypothetical protein TL16_g06408 [Triparma laevis f. inornata]|uniref:WW domain-containing protein n=1 Tax=Triparma laevis f. inornata TaxID=1714386 RepID=A0A9W7ARJ9_9STRA|nr:hypothetical protein TL16_g06408 [Triparma laevis f. inornata]
MCADCGEGKYLDFTGAVAETQCKVCPMGKYNDVPGLGTVCPDCQKGKYAPATGYTSCTNCIVGTYASDDGSTECTQCEEGKHSGVHGSETCDDCAAGTFTDYRGAVVCIFCSGGKYSSEGASVCLDCGQGTYSNPGSASCDTCEHTQGFVANGEGNIQCEYCGIGKYADTTTHECKSCMQGKYSVGGVNECLDCESGKFNLNDGASSCTTCEPGSVPNGATGCTQCIAGKYAAFGASSCSDCGGEGQFSSSAGAASCSTAAVGTKPNLSRNDQTGLPFCKTAPAGTKPTPDRQGTEICSPGKYSIGGNDECSECGVGKTSDAGAIGCRTCATCGLGKYQIAECTANTETECGDCVAGKASMGGTVSECARCDGPGEYSEPMASVCKTAPAGYKPMVTGDDGLKTGIEMCLKNTFSIGATDECTNCAPGGHSNPGDSACDQCLTGKYYNEQTNDCTLCPKNTFSINGASDSNGCTPCASGEHSLEGSGYCQACPQYMEYDETTKKCVCLASFIRVGSDGDGNGGTCTCKPGETLMGTTCQPCEEAKWKAEEGVTSCNLCEDTLKGAITEFTGSQDITDCECPSRTFDNLKGTCVVIVDGVDAVNDGMTLTGLIMEPGFWRTGPRSVDVRECPVSDACIGGNETKAYCRDGHNGPYCNLCEDGYAKDPFLLCQSCDESGESVAITAAVLVAIALALAGATYLMKRGAKKEEERLSREGQARSGESTYKRARRRLKNGGKIIFSGAQISVSLPRVIPSFPMPENFKETLRTMRFFNLSVIEMFSMGCWTANFNVYYQVLVMTVPIIVICVLLLFMGLAIREHRQGLFTIAIAVTYLTLPTITTMIFSLFPCDDLDDGGRYLRSDYSIRCDGEERTGWVVFGLIMILVFPIGVTSAYWMLLWADRKKIQQPVEVREEDEELMTKAFLFEPYKPEYWYFEVVETARRLMMTGFLSTIEPGSFVQLSSGLLMSIGYVLYISNVHPYVEVRDNTIAVLTGCQLVLVFVTASFMKYQTKLEEGEAYEMQGLGVILILSYLVIFVLFLFWAWHQKDDTSRSSSTYATKTIKNLGKKVVSKHGLKSVVSIRGGRKNSASGGIELSERSLGGRVEEEERVFAYENPMTHQNFTTTIGGVSRGSEEEEEEDVKPPAIPMRVTSTGLLKLSKADDGGGGDEAGMTGITPPSSAPPPPPPRENEGEITVNVKCGTKNTRLHGEWSQMWDEEHKAPYWMNKDGVTSTWDRPLGY